MARFPDADTRCEALLDFVRFLASENVLTEGGRNNLASGLEGRNQSISLALQDVRSWAHHFCLEIVESQLQKPASWKELLERYLQRFDKGKPRRPTHLQRLYLEWSSDLSWRGLLRACRDHPQIWTELELALTRLEEPTMEKLLLELAMECRTGPQPWLARLLEESLPVSELFGLLPHLEKATLEWKLKNLVELANRGWHFRLRSVFVESFVCSMADARSLKGLGVEMTILEKYALDSASLNPGLFSANFFCSFRSFITQRASVERLLACLKDDDPLKRAVFGPRPGRRWLEAWEDEMNELIELRSVSR